MEFFRTTNNLSFRVPFSTNGDSIYIKIYYFTGSSTMWFDFSDSTFKTNPTQKESTMTFLETEIWYINLPLLYWPTDKDYVAVTRNATTNEIFNFYFRVSDADFDVVLNRINNIKSKTDLLLFNSNNYVLSSPQTDVILSSSQPNYEPAKAGDAMTLVASERSAVAQSVWSNPTRALTDKVDFSLTSEYNAAKNALQSNDSRLNNLDATISSRLGSTDSRLNNLDAAISSRAPASTALSTEIWTNQRAASLDRLDATISSRAPSSTALSSEIWTNQRAANLDRLDIEITSRLAANDSRLNNLDTTISSRLSSADSRLNYLDEAVSTRAPSSTALSSVIWTNDRAAKLDNIDIAVSSRLANNDSRLDNLDARVSSRLATNDTRIDNLDATVSSRAPAVTALSNTIWTNNRAANLDNLDVAVSSRLQSDDIRLNRLDATISSRLESTDSRLNNLDAAISSRAPSSTALSNAIWTNDRAANLDKLDATISSRLQSDDIRINNLDAKVSTRLATNDARIDNIDAPVSSRAPAATALSNTIWTNDRAASLDKLDVAVSSRLQSDDTRLNNLDATVSSRPTLRQILDGIKDEHGDGPYGSFLLNKYGSNILTINVKDNDNNPLPETHIGIYFNDTLVTVGYTDINGSYSTGLADGNYKIVCNKILYMFNTQNISITSDATLNIFGTYISTKITEPDDTSLCRVYTYLYYAGTNTPMSVDDVKFIYKYIIPHNIGNVYFSERKINYTYNGASGLFYFDVPKGSIIDIEIDGVLYGRVFVGQENTVELRKVFKKL